MAFEFTGQLLLRMPVKTPGDYAADPQQLLNDPYFQAAIRLATPSFYATLERQHFDLNKLTAKEVHTLQKYINRYCFRPTPFGLFSSVSLVNWADHTDNGPVDPGFGTFIRPAMLVQHLLRRQTAAHQDPDELLENNPSIYRVLNEYRFFRTGLDETGSTRDYQLQSIAFSRLLKDLLNLARHGCTRQAAVAQIMTSAASSAEEAEDYAAFLLESQLLVRFSRLSITGDDHLPDELKQLSYDHGIPDPAYLDQLEHNVQSLVPASAGLPDKLSVILKRDGDTGGLPTAFQEKIRDGLEALALLSPAGQPASMDKFIQSYQQHFEGQMLPLLQALDPEAGIGYQQPETERNNPLLETLNIPYQSQSGESGSWTASHSMILEAWLRDRSAGQVIRLLDSDLERLKTDQADEPILGMSVLFRMAEDKVFIENAGGINAPALMGRFTLADAQIERAAIAMAEQLQNQNPDVIFAELLHLADPHTDNINRRAHIYDYELPITGSSALPKARQLQLSDLYIRIVDQQVWLFSRQHQKVVIPRLSSAYNHSLNKLPLFRFLADLPYQYGRSSLGIDLRQLFPDLHFYPRVEYKQAILCLATWVLTEDQIARLQEAIDNTAEAFIQLNDSIRLPRYFSLAEGDQELVFDGEDPKDIAFFAASIRQKRTVVLKEFLSQPIVRQYNTYLLPTEPLTLPKVPEPSNGNASAKRKYVPGSEWLYLKVYAPKIGVNRLLATIRPLLRKKYVDHRISQWFFIRYEDHAPHIRLRLRVDPAAVSEILIAFKAKLENRIQQHVIREFQIDVYSRELERYAPGGIENTERFFWASSELVLHFITQAKKIAAISTHAFALYSTYAIIREFISEADEQLRFTIESFGQFLPEFKAGAFKVQLDKKYRELSTEIVSAFKQHDAGLLSGSAKAGKELINSLSPIKELLNEPSESYPYLRSIIHMHLNRIFTDESRKQEMITYYLLHKYLLSVKGRNKRPGNDANGRS